VLCLLKNASTGPSLAVAQRRKSTGIEFWEIGRGDKDDGESTPTSRLYARRAFSLSVKETFSR